MENDFMVISAEQTRKNLKHLFDKNMTHANYSASQEIRGNFKTVCEYEGIKKYAFVLEDLIGQVNQNYFSKNKKLKITFSGYSDRSTSSLNCNAQEWETFKEGCKNNGLTIADVIESIMSDFVSQIESENNFNVVKGKIKK